MYDTATRDKLIFPSAITQILCHSSVSYPVSTHFSPMCAIDAATIRLSEAQLRSKQPRTKMATPPTRSTLSTSVPSSSSTGGVTLEVVIAQLQCTDAHLDILTTELYQANTRVGCIARQQACLDGFIASPFPSPEASKDKDDGDDSGGAFDGDEASDSSSDDEMIASQ